MSDPNGWVLNPPTKFVKIHSLTSQASSSLNGQLAVVVGYVDDSRRYVVVPTSAQDRQVSLRADNLVACGYLESVRAQYQVVAGSPVLRRRAAELWDRQLKPRLPAPLQSPTTFAAAIGAALLASMYLLGPSRTLLAISFVAMAAMVVGPVLQETRDPRVVVRQIVPRTQVLLRQTGLPLASRVAGNAYLTTALLAVIVAVFVSGMVPPPSPRPSSPTAASWAPSRWLSPPSAAAPPLSSSDREHYYKLGFDDAAARRAFGESLASSSSSSSSSPIVERKLDETTLDLSSSSDHGVAAFAEGRPPPSYFGAPPPPASRRKNLLGIGNLASIGYTGNALYQLGMSGDGEGRWSFDALYRNVAALPPWRTALLGLSIYRILSSLLA